MEELYDAKCREGEVGNTFSQSNSYLSNLFISAQERVLLCILRLVGFVDHILESVVWN